MYATRTPSLRIDQSDLKCKNGCGFYGNVQWQGYCSKCHREQAHRQRKSAERAEAGTSTVIHEHQILERQPKTSPIAAGFSKFEEKKLRQTDSLKKNKLLKLNVFRKASNAKDVAPEKEVRDKPVRSQFIIPANELELQKRDFFDKFPRLDLIIEKDTRKYITFFFQVISKQYNLKTVDELSDITQNFYQNYAKHMDDSDNYANIDSETKELLLDFVEKHSMTYLHSILFSPFHSDDEKKDAQIRRRIKQLSWVSPSHLDCRIDQGNPVVRDLLYSAITELVAMDSVVSPGEKLSHIVGCCRGVVGVVSAASGGPASADELLPALIFTVLKANPPRLTSNINYITRFCNAARLMTGEGGYYFTNLCCAVSFIENLTPESLNMTKSDFDGYMSLPTAVGAGSWVAALSFCEGLHDLQDQLRGMQILDKNLQQFEANIVDLNEQVSIFKDEIHKKVADVLARTPLDFRTRESRLIGTLECEDAQTNSIPESASAENPVQDIFDSIPDDLIESIPVLPAQKSPISNVPKVYNLPLNSVANFALALDNRPVVPTLRTVGAGAFLSPSPIFGFDSFDQHSLFDELATPGDDFGGGGGLTNVNYDIDLSDLSGENSTAEEAPPVASTSRYSPRYRQDPFSPIRQDPFEPQRPKDPFEPQRPKDPFSPDGIAPSASSEYESVWIGHAGPTIQQSGVFHTPLRPAAAAAKSDLFQDSSILDDSPTTAEGELPSPIKPLSSAFREN